MSLTSAAPILRAEKITRVFPGTVALDAVDFEVRPGQVHALIGENGAGKSTLMRIIAGADRPTSGRLLIDDEPVEFRSTRDADARGISMIYQELNLCPNLTEAENLFLARERKRRGWAIDSARQEREASEALRPLDPTIRPQSRVGELRLGGQQVVEIARSLVRDARILIMDEPTSALSGKEVEALFGVIRRLSARGVSVVYISHRLEEVLRIGDFITVLRDGKRVASAPVREVDLGWIVANMVGGRLETIFSRPVHPPGGVCLEVRDLSLERPGVGMAFEGVTFALRRGEVLGLYGLMGAGRTELTETLLGVRRPASGEILLDGRPVTRKPAAARIRDGIALVPEDRQISGVVPTQSVYDNIALAGLGRYRTGPFLKSAALRSRIDELIRELAIRLASPGQPITSLSGGNQQKAIFARGLLLTPKVLLLDEPTRGIDVGAKAEICRIIDRLAAEGMGILLVSSELEEIRGMADRILVMSRGRITAALERDAAGEEALVRAAAAPAEVAGRTNVEV
jgi:erythritol transport system ATP-binding protein